MQGTRSAIIDNSNYFVSTSQYSFSGSSTWSIEYYTKGSAANINTYTVGISTAQNMWNTNGAIATGLSNSHYIVGEYSPQIYYYKNGINLDVWRHVKYEWNGSQWKIYLDGTDVTMGPAAGAAEEFDGETSGYIYINSRSGFSYKIDDLKITVDGTVIINLDFD
ncbi:MAG: hypothetical protein ISR65_04740 [Bacteriovoracaceae bacterium]|nr:hypothetical protein [Bacteriovoracaceae bacterium]